MPHFNTLALKLDPNNNQTSDRYTQSQNVALDTKWDKNKMGTQERGCKGDLMTYRQMSTTRGNDYGRLCCCWNVQ